MRKFLLVCFMALFASVAVAANTSAEPKIGVLDLAQVLQNSPQMDKVSKDLEKKFKPRQEKIERLVKEVKEGEAKLKRDASVMSKSEVAKLKESLISSDRDLRRLQEDYMTDAREAQKVAMDKVLKQVNDIVQGIAEKGNFDLILQRSNVAFASKRVEITSEVIKQLKSAK